MHQFGKWKGVFLLLLLGATNLFAGPKEEVDQIIQNLIDPNSQGNRLLEIVLAHPTEPVLLSAARWPWGHPDGGRVAGVLRQILKPYVARSPKLKDYVSSMIHSADGETKRQGIKMLGSALADSPEIRADLRAMARQGDSGFR